MNKEDAMDRCKWRKMIKDVRWLGWVWVGVSSGTGLPGLSQTQPLNGCVCVCVSYPSWSSDILYQVPPSTTIHSILLVQFICLTVLFHICYPGPLWSSSWSGTPYFILHTFLHTFIIFFSQHVPVPSQPVFAVVQVLRPLFLISLSAPYLEICLLP